MPPFLIYGLIVTMRCLCDVNKMFRGSILLTDVFARHKIFHDFLLHDSSKLEYSNFFSLKHILTQKVMTFLICGIVN